MVPMMLQTSKTDDELLENSQKQRSSFSQVEIELQRCNMTSVMKSKKLDVVLV